MDELIAKLKNLGYEVFGIILPGLIGEIFFLIWWFGLGANSLSYTFGVFPELTLSRASGFIQSLTTNTGIGIAIPSLIVAYFTGHILNWIGRSATADESIIRSTPRRVWSALRFKFLKPNKNFDESLEGFFCLVEMRFRSDDKEPLKWGQFFPLAKCFLARSLPTSLVSTYQTKYTLHRSITVAASILFWMSMTVIALVCFRYWVLGSLPVLEIGMMVTIAVTSLVLVWGFSDGYAYNWKLFGNTIITESYSILYGPSSNESQH